MTIADGRLGIGGGDVELIDGVRRSLRAVRVGPGPDVTTDPGPLEGAREREREREVPIGEGVCR